MSIIKKHFLLIALSALGASSVAALYLSPEIFAYFKPTNSAKLSVANDNTCTPHAQNYQESLARQAHQDVYVSGCGGIF